MFNQDLNFVNAYFPVPKSTRLLKNIFRQQKLLFAILVRYQLFIPWLFVNGINSLVIDNKTARTLQMLFIFGSGFLPVYWHWIFKTQNKNQIQIHYLLDTHIFREINTPMFAMYLYVLQTLYRVKHIGGLKC